MKTGSWCYLGAVTAEEKRICPATAASRLKALPQMPGLAFVPCMLWERLQARWRKSRQSSNKANTRSMPPSITDTIACA